MTPEQQQAVAAAARDWSASHVPYVYGGSTKAGADCSGSVSGIFAQAGINVGRLNSGDFRRSPAFVPVTGAPPLGDVGWYPGHVVIYGGDQAGPGNDVWSASHTGGPVFGAAKSSWYGRPTWYHYAGP